MTTTSTYKVAKDDTLQSILTASQTLAKDASLQSILTQVQGISSIDTKLSNLLTKAGEIYDKIGTGSSSAADVSTYAQIHNKAYRGSYLGETITAAQSNAIATGTFEDLYPGDYWEKEIRYYDAYGTAITATVRMLIAECDPFLGKRTNQHHVAVVPQWNLYNAKMYDSDITTYGYFGSKMYTDYLAGAEEAFRVFFGSEHICTYKLTVTNASDGTAANTTWLEVTNRVCDLMSIYQVVNTHALTNANLPKDDEATQLALFKLQPEFIKLQTSSASANAVNYWLRDLYSTTDFAYVTPSCAVSRSNASYTCGVRPLALIY